MKKKFLTILMLFVLFLGVIYKPVLIKADSGFDSSWDSGSSDWGSSSDWSSSSSYNSIDFDSSPELGIALVIMIVLLVIALLVFKSEKSQKLILLSFLILFTAILPISLFIAIWSMLTAKADIITIMLSLFLIIIMIPFILIIYLFIKRMKNIIKETAVEIGKNNHLLKLTDEEIKNKLPDLNIEEFNEIVFNNYKDIQDSWMNFDLDTIKNLVSDEIYNMYSMQLDTLKVKGQKNMMENINYVDNYICDITVENDVTTISTILSVTCHDYLVDNNNKVIRGNKNKELYYIYRLTFTKNNINKTINHCPNCGAKINSKKDTKCHYCGATIVNNNSEWIMTKKEMLKQQTK